MDQEFVWKKFLKSPQWLRDFKIKKNRNFFKRLIFNPQIIQNGGWHFNSVKKPADLVKKFKSFCHADDYKNVLDEEIIKEKIEKLEVLYDRKHELRKVNIDGSYPDYFIKNKSKFKEFILWYNSKCDIKSYICSLIKLFLPNTAIHLNCY